MGGEKRRLGEYVLRTGSVPSSKTARLKKKRGPKVRRSRWEGPLLEGSREG